MNPFESLDTQPTQPAPYRMSSEFWFSDGNILLLVGHYAFKVHRGQLERHSDVFRTMLSIPQPAESQSREDSVTLFDEPADVYCLLRALYDGVYFSQPFISDFPFLSSVLRMSCKYFVPIPRRQCVARLTRYFPSTLAAWDRREATATDPYTRRYTPRDAIPSPILVIRLAHELNLESILPAAFYDLCRYGTSKTVVGTPPLPALSFCGSGARSPVSSESGSEGMEVEGRDIPESPPPGSPLSSPILVQDSEPVCLSSEDLTTTFLGRESAQRAIASFLTTYLHDRTPSPSCLNLQPPPSPPSSPALADTAHICRDAFYFIHLNTLRAVGGIAAGRDADPLYTLTQMADMLHRTDFSDGRVACGLKMCARCKEEFTRDVRRGREETWALLPGWFGLADWEVLERRARETEER